jgi:hypothetical protein
VRGKERKRGSLGKRPEDEFALGDANVRNGKALMVDLKVVVEKNVKVDVARSLVDEFLAAKSVFDVLQRIQELEGLQGRLNLVYSLVTGTHKTKRTQTNLAGAVDKSILV